AFEDYQTAFQIAMLGPAAGHSCPLARYSAHEAMHFLVANGTLTRDESYQIRKAAFGAAQLDDDPTTLYDAHSGGPGDDTISVKRFSKAQELVTANLTALNARKDASDASSSTPADSAAMLTQAA